MNRDKKEVGTKAQKGLEEMPIPEEKSLESTMLDPETLAMNNNDPVLQNGHSKDEMLSEESEETGDQEEDKKVRVAILSEEGFEEVELTSPKQALEDAGFTVEVISSHGGKIKGWDKTDWGHEVPVDKTLHDARPYEYDALVLPGGVMNPDKLRQNKEAVVFLRQFIVTGKPVAAICHGAQTLIETGMIEGHTMTSYPSLKTDLRNAGVKWVDKEMVHSGQFITSRKPADLEYFNKELINSLHLQEH